MTDHVFGPGTRKEIVAELARRSPEDLRKEAEELFERVIEQYGNIVPAWADKSKTTLGQRAEGILNRIRHLEIGKVAPEIEGEDVDGTRFKLSDYRGKVVLLTFTGDWCPPCHSLYPHERRFIEQLKGRPFVVLSVETDQDRETWRKAIAKGDVGWRCWWDGSTHGPITTSWGVKGFPSLYLIDARGVIRDHGRGGIDEKDAEALFTKIKSLVQDAEAAAKP